MFIRRRWSLRVTGSTSAILSPLSTLSSASSSTNRRSKWYGDGVRDEERGRGSDRDKDRGGGGGRDREHFVDLHKDKTLMADNNNKKKRKKRGPPGPFEFPGLTAETPAHSDLPFAFRYSYTEVPKSEPIRFQEKFSPFGPNRLDRMWDGQQALPNPSVASSSPPPMSLVSSSTSSSINNQRVAKSHAFPKLGESKYTLKGIKLVNPPSPIGRAEYHRKDRTREEILGEPLTRDEVKELVEHSIRSRRQLNIGRDGLTHNTLIEIHDHWKRECVVRVRCKGVPTLDMENVIFQIEDKTGGKIIEKAGGTLYVFRGRNYSYKERPIIPPMLWKPHSPIYPKLIQEAPSGLRVDAANFLRKRGLKIMPLCKLAKNGYYGDLVNHVKEAFKDDVLVRIDCTGLNTSDYKRIGGKLKDLVPCILLSFDKEQIIVWNGEYMKVDSGPKHWFKSEKIGYDSTTENVDITPEDVNIRPRNVKADGKDNAGVVDVKGDSVMNLGEMGGVCKDVGECDEHTSNECGSEYISDEISNKSI